MTHDELVRVVNLLRDLAMHTPEGCAAFVHAGLAPEPANQSRDQTLPIPRPPGVILTREQNDQLLANCTPEPAKPTSAGATSGGKEKA